MKSVIHHREQRPQVSHRLPFWRASNLYGSAHTKTVKNYRHGKHKGGDHARDANPFLELRYLRIHDRFLLIAVTGRAS